MPPAVHFPVESGYKWSIQVHLLPSITQLPEKNDICARFRKSNINTKVITDKNNSVDLVAKKLQACSISKISLRIYQKHQICYAALQQLQKKAIQSWFNWQPKTSLHQPFCTVWIMHYSFLWKWITQNYSKIGNQSDCSNHQDHWVILTNNNNFFFQQKLEHKYM